MILSNIHFTAIVQSNDNKLGKIKDLLETSNQHFGKYYIPGPDIVIDEFIVPFKGRLSWKQFIPSKRTRYVIKAFRLCAHNGYALKNIIYTGKIIGSEEKFSTKGLVENLREGYLNKNYTLFTDNYYTNLELAKSLLNKQTHLVEL